MGGHSTNPTALESTPASQNAAAVFLSSFPSVHSMETMLRALVRIVELDAGRRLERSGRRPAVLAFPWHAVRYQHAQAIRAKLIERYPAPATCNVYLSALRGVLKEAWRLGQIPSDEYNRAVDLPAVKGSRVSKGREVERGELRELFVACAEDESAAGRRDAALLALLAGGGLRRAEAVALQLADYDQASGALVIMGKGNRQRTGYLTNGSRTAVDEWLVVRGQEPGPLFLPVNKGGRVELRPMAPQAVRDMLLKRASEAGGRADVSPHDFRRTFVSTLLDQGVDIVTVAGMAGHASVTTTQRYDRRGERAKRAAAELIHVPFKSGSPKPGMATKKGSG